MKKRKNKEKKKTGSVIAVNWKRVILTALPVALFLIILYFVSYAKTDPYFKIEEINVTGNYYLADSEIINASKLNIDDNINIFSEKVIENNIKSLTRIKYVKVIKHYPHSVNIKVWEFDQIALVRSDGQFHELAGNGIIYPFRRNITDPDMPILTGLNQNITGRIRVNNKILNTIEGLKEVRGIYYLSSELDFSNRHSIKLFLRNGKIALISRVTAPADIRRLELLLRSMDLEPEDKVIDLRFRKRAYIRESI